MSDMMNADDDAQQEMTEQEWLSVVSRNEAYQFLADPAEDIYTLVDGKPFTMKP